MNNVYSLLGIPASGDRLKAFVVPAKLKLEPENLLWFVVQVAEIVEEHGIKRSVTDWPFENFWWNPSEPNHSRLLGYFIDPKESHSCGIILLRRLFDVLGFTALPVDRHCEVRVEKERIDVLIRRRLPHSLEGKYAVIIENKVNGADDRPGQLKRYYEKMKDAGFSDIRCVYLPLTHRTPSDDSRSDIPRERIKEASFKVEITTWLKEAQQDKRVIPEMRDNLRHYSNLLRYLLWREREHAMQEKIFQLLKEADSTGTLPGWEEVIELKESVNKLETSYLLFLRSKLLLSIQRILREEKDLPPTLVCQFDDGRITDVQDFFEHPSAVQQWVGYRLDDVVMVAVGVDKSGQIYVGYQKPQGDEKEKLWRKFQKFLERNYPEKLDGGDEHWYGWHWYQDAKMVVNAYPQRVGALVNELVKMHSEMMEILRTFSGQSN